MRDAMTTKFLGLCLGVLLMAGTPNAVPYTVLEQDVSTSKPSMSLAVEVIVDHR